MNETFGNLPLRIRYGLWLYVGFAFFAAWDMSYWWLEKEDYSFGFIVPFFVGYVLFERWPWIKSILFNKDNEKAKVPVPCENTLNSLRPLWAFIAWSAVFGGFVFYAFGALLRAAQGPVTIISWCLAVGIACLLLCGAYILSETDVHGNTIAPAKRLKLCAWLLFPALVWFVSAPLPGPVDAFIRLNLLEAVTFIVFNIFDILGMPLEQRGNVLVLPKGEVGVQDACSGIRSLTACLFAGSFLSAVFLDKFWKKISLVVVSMFFAFFNNILRSLFLTGWAYAKGPEAANKIHDATGYAVLGLTCVMLMVLIPIFNFKIQPPDDSEPPNAGAGNTATPETA